MEKRIEDIVFLTINRPDVLNALNRSVYKQLSVILERLDGDSTVRTVVLTGQGQKAFAAGADIAEMVDLNGEEGRQFSLLSQQAANRLASIRQTTIAAVNGYAFGGGFELLLACDLCVAAENASFAFPEVGLGIIPSGGGTQRLARIAGVRCAKDLILTGRRISANEALTMGIVNYVVPKDELMKKCFEIGEQLSSNSGYAVSLAKQAIEEGYDMDLDRGCLHEGILQGLAFAGIDKSERMRRFLRKK